MLELPIAAHHENLTITISTLGEQPVEDLNVTTWRSSNPVLGLRLFD
jgi:hypothetical protein